MKTFLISLITVIICISWTVYAQDDEFEELKHISKKSRKPLSFFGHHALGGYGFHALAILYWLKVKAVIIAFIIGTAIVWGSKYVWGNNKSCPKEVIHEGPIIPFSHGPMWSGHDHIPYSPSYSPSFSSSPYDHHDHHDHHISSDSFGSSFLDSPPPISGAEHFASEKKWKRASKRQSRQFESEEQISNIAFAFLGVDSDACRRRFVCEWEFRSKRSPITSLVFRVLGRGIFTKYLKTSNEIKSFDDCGKVHDECRFIEQHVPEKEYEDSQEEDIVNHSHNDDNLVPSSSPSSESSQENDENTNENETETSTQTIQNDNENKEVNDHYSVNIVKNDSNKLSSNKVRKLQPEVKLSMNNYENQNQKKKKNIMAQALFNRSKSKLRVVPIRR